MTRYRFFAGKGGVGKTTCAASFALSLARGGARTLVVSTDPMHSLGDVLALKLSAAPREVSLGAAREGSPGARGGRLFAVELDADRALSRWLASRERAFRVVAGRGTYLDNEDLDSLFRLSLPGVDELVGLVELRRLARGFDEVVVDTAPTGHTLRLLEMPEKLAQLATVLDDLQAKHHAMTLSLRGAVRLDAEDKVIAELREEAASLRALLRPESAEFHWVLLPEALSLAEANDGIAALREGGLRVVRIVANRVLPAPRGRCAFCDARRGAEGEVLRALAGLGAQVETLPEVLPEPRGPDALLAAARLSRALPVSRASRSAPSAARPGQMTKGDGSKRSSENGVLGLLLGQMTKSAAGNARTRGRGRDERFGQMTKKHGVAGSDADGTGSAADRSARQPASGGVRILFVGGKGGVGKTTVAAAVALRAALERRVLLLSTDPAHSLGDVLAEPIGDEERAVAVPGAPPDGARRDEVGRGTSPGGAEKTGSAGLWARELDAKAAFRARRESYRAAVEELFDTLRGGSRFDAPFDRAVMEDLIELAPPGLDEIFSLLAVADALPRFDLIVVDTAPTGHALRLLELVPKAREWVQALLQILLKYRRVSGLGRLARELTGTARELRGLQELLHDPERARFLAVTRAAELPRLETERLRTALRELGIAAPAVLINALTPSGGCARCRKLAARESAELASLREGLPKRGGGWDMIAAPARPIPPRGASALIELSRTWTRFAP